MKLIFLVATGIQYPILFIILTKFGYGLGSKISSTSLCDLGFNVGLGILIFEC